MPVARIVDGFGCGRVTFLVNVSLTETACVLDATRHKILLAIRKYRRQSCFWNTLNGQFI